jgi:hypothetical protein
VTSLRGAGFGSLPLRLRRAILLATMLPLLLVLELAQAAPRTGGPGAASPPSSAPTPSSSPSSSPSSASSPAASRPGGETVRPSAELGRQVLSAYKEGTRLFEARREDQAYEEFRRSYELSGRSYLNGLFMMAQCQYHRGLLKEARALYAQYLESPGHKSDLAELARGRIAAIDNRKSALSIHTVPNGVDVLIEDEGGRRVEAGQAPNRFEVPPGRYRLTLSKPRYGTQRHDLTVDIADAQPLFFQLSPVPARLEVWTHPPGAALYVRGNRARNPYVQTVEPGKYELYAEARDYESGLREVEVGPGETRRFGLELKYVQRSGRAELIGFWTAAGALAGATGVLARLSAPAEDIASSATVVAAGGVVGGITGALVSTASAPDYIRDNLALFRIGAAWIGAAEGALIGLTIEDSYPAAWIGGASGLVGGALLGSALDAWAPSYGRVALIHSGAALGGLAGLLAVPALAAPLDLETGRHRPQGLLAGLNLGLVAGLALAYLPDQRSVPLSWQRVMLVDLAAAAGGFAGALVSTLAYCTDRTSDGARPGEPCEFSSRSGLPRARTARFTLVGGVLGLAAGWALTRHYDDRESDRPGRDALGFLPVPTALPTPAPGGGTRLAPGLAASGRF